MNFPTPETSEGLQRLRKLKDVLQHEDSDLADAARILIDEEIEDGCFVQRIDGQRFYVQDLMMKAQDLLIRRAG